MTQVEKVAKGEKYGDRLFRADHPARELPRLTALSAMHDPDTFRVLSAIGVKPGWSVLDVGPGAGVTTRWLANEVGRDGSVLALDRDTRLLAGLAEPENLSLLEADALTAQPGTFDLVHCRILLMHLPRRAELLARMASWLRPGGRLVVADHVDFATHSSPYPALRATFAAMRRMLNSTLGTDFHQARDHAVALRRLGLVDVGLDMSTPELRAGSPANDFWLRTWDELRARMDIEEGVYQEARGLLKDPAVVDLSLTLVTGWGRRRG
jgi:SAM-dependent methyltransferase